MESAGVVAIVTFSIGRRGAVLLGDVVSLQREKRVNLLTDSPQTTSVHGVLTSESCSSTATEKLKSFGSSGNSWIEMEKNPENNEQDGLMHLPKLRAV